MLPLINSAYFIFDSEVYIWPLGRIESLRHDMAEIHTESYSDKCFSFENDEIVSKIFILRKNFPMLKMEGTQFYAILQDAGRAKVYLTHLNTETGMICKFEDTKMQFSTDRVTNF
jgi:hypothetical protein